MGTPEGIIRSVFKKIGKEDETINTLDSNKGDLYARTEKIKEKVKEQYEIYKLKSNLPDNNMIEIVDKATLLLSTYKSSENIPEEELLKDPSFDDARLLALCQLIEREKEPTFH
jgi:hypothetical protein